MKYNAVLDAQKSAGGVAAGSNFGLATLKQTTTQGQTVFMFADLIGGTLLLFFVDGILYEPVEALEDITPNKDYYFNGTDGTITITNGQDAGVVVSGLYVSSGSADLQDEPVTLQEVKDWLRIDLDDDDDILTMLITAAREHLEAYTNVSFLRRVVTANIMNQLGGQMLPYGPVGDIIYLKDTFGTEVSADNYKLEGIDFKRLKTAFCDDVTIQYNAGYTYLPKDLKSAILAQVAWSYSNRGDEKVASAMSVEAKMMVQKYRRVI